MSTRLRGSAIPADWLSPGPVEADVGHWEGGASGRGAGLVGVRGGAVALAGRHTVTAAAVEP